MIRTTVPTVSWPGVCWNSCRRIWTARSGSSGIAEVRCRALRSPASWSGQGCRSRPGVRVVAGRAARWLLRPAAADGPARPGRRTCEDYPEVAVALCKYWVLSCRFGEIRPRNVVRKMARRYRDIAVENLVLADRRCNNDKRDLLPGPVHVTAWTHRNQHHDAALTALAAGRPGGTPTRPGPSRWPARSTATCRRAAPRYGSGTKMSPWPTLPQPQRPCANDGQTAKRRRGPHTGGSQVGSHPRPTPGHTEPIGSFDSFSLPGIQTQPALRASL